MPPSSSRSDSGNKVVTGVLAALIFVLLLGGVVAAATTDDEDTPAEDRQEQDEARRRFEEEERKRQEEANLDAEQRAAADRRAFDLINANKETCERKYIPEAEARAQAALAQVREQEAALNEVLNALPPGRARDTLAAQIKPDVDASTDLINAELRAARTRCQIAFTIYQYTRETPPEPD
jgi:flagellar biosynthesis GTPase FlhF